MHCGGRGHDLSKRPSLFVWYCQLLSAVEPGVLLKWRVHDILQTPVAYYGRGSLRRCRKAGQSHLRLGALGNAKAKHTVDAGSDECVLIYQ
jgi:hypothetical protein